MVWQLAEQDYNELRSQHLRNKTLFEDPEFPARGTSVYFSKRARDIEWKRPKVAILFNFDASSHLLSKNRKLRNWWRIHNFLWKEPRGSMSIKGNSATVGWWPPSPIWHWTSPISSAWSHKIKTSQMGLTPEYFTSASGSTITGSTSWSTISCPRRTANCSFSVLSNRTSSGALF